MSALPPYLAQDRRRALARNESLPDRADGAVLFADISGFTPLTEAFTRSLGARRGAEELTRQLNAVYDALIVEIENFDGSVINFAGDAALCWFAENSAGEPRAALRATACAFALQRAMQQFSAVPLPDNLTVPIAIKIAIAYGAVRRFVVGDPNIRVLDVIAGAPVTRSGIAEHLTQRGEIALDEPTVQALGAQIEIQAWRNATDTDARFAIARALLSRVPPTPPAAFPPLADSQVKPWLFDAVYKRLAAKGEIFLTELRPVVALFGRFQGIDFETDETADEKLNLFISRVQQILDRYGGALLELTIGDKGSYFYAAFGAPQIHEDDARRAVFAARELFPLCVELGFLEPLQVGISQGVMRVGAYGGRTRRIYGAQGDEVNLAARLMTEAKPGTLLVSGHIQKNVANEFDLEPLPPIHLKGKAEPLPPFLVVGVRETRVKQLQEAYYTLPMIGREAELALILTKIELARRGQGQIIALSAPAGVGKSRMTAEIIRLMRRRRETSYGGECQSFGVNIPYLVWGPILRAFFGIDTNLPTRRQIRALENEIAALAPRRFEALPLLSALVDLPIPENDFTRALEPEFRKTVLHALLRDCFSAAADEARAQGQALLFVLEDIHWIDPASLELLQELAAGIEKLPIVILLNYRPSETDAHFLPQLDTLAFFTRLALNELTDAQGADLIRAKLAQHAPESGQATPPALIERVNAQAQGNPFYIEQLLDYIHDRDLDFRNPQQASAFELPNTLHRLVLTRLERLSQAQRLALKAASVIGRWFSFAHLCGYFPALGSPEQTRAELTLTLRSDLIALDHPDPDLTYVFKHVVTHQVAYEALTFATRAQLHEAYAQFLERHNEPERTLDLLAYHYDRSKNKAKRLEYLTRAGQAAAARFANTEAVNYLTRALALTTDAQRAERFKLLDARARVFEVQGARDAQRADLDALERLAQELDDPFKYLSVLLEQGWLAERLAEHETARALIRRVQEGLTQRALGADARAHLEIEVLLLEGAVLWQQGAAAAARPIMARALAHANARADDAEQARARGFLAQVLNELGEYDAAQTNYEQLLEYARARQDKRREWSALTTLGLIATERGDFDLGLAHYAASLDIVRAIGDRQGEGLVLSNIAQAQLEQGAYDRALELGLQARAIANAINDRRGVCRIELNLGETYRLLGQYDNAEAHTADAQRRANELEDWLYQVGAMVNHAAIQLDRQAFARAQASAVECVARARAIHHRALTGFAYNLLAQTQLALDKLGAAQESCTQALASWQTLESSPYRLQTHACLAEIARRQNDFARAQNECAAIFEFLQAHPNRQGAPSALAALLACYQVARARHDANASALLDKAYAQLQARAEKISDAALRQCFLENVPTNAEITRLWHAQSS